MTRYKQITGLLFSSLAMQGLNFLVLLIVARLYSDTEVADFAKIIAFIGFLILSLEFGTNNLIIARAGEMALGRIINLRFKVLIVVTFTTLVCGDFLLKAYGVDPDWLLFILAYSVTLSFINSLGYLKQGRGALKQYAAYIYLRGVIHFALVVFAIFSTSYSPVFLWLLIGVIVNICFLLAPLISKMHIQTKVTRGGVAVRHIANYLLASFFVMLILRSDAVILGLISDFELAIFFKAKALAMLVSMVSSSISGYYLSKGLESYALEFWSFFKGVGKVVLFFLPFIFIFIFIFHQYLVGFIFGYENEEQIANVFLILSLSYVFGFFTNPLSAIIIRSEQSRFNLLLNLVQLVIVFTLGILLLDYGALGLSVAVFSAHLFSFFVVFIYLKRNYALFVK